MAKKNQKKSKISFVSPANKKRKWQMLNKLYKSGQYDHLLDVLKEVDADSKDGDFLYLKAKTFYKLDRKEKAMSLIQKAHQLKPDNVEYLQTTAEWLEEQAQILSALAVYSGIIRIEPNNHLILQKMGLMLERLERFEQAITCFKKAIDIQPHNPASLRHIGLCYYLMGDLDSAAEFYERAVSTGGNTSSGWVLIGNLFLSKGQRENANQAFRKAIEIDEKCYFAYSSYVRSASFSQTERDALIEKLEKLLLEKASISTEKRLCHFSLGKLYHQKQDYDKAIVHYGLGNSFRVDKVGKFSKEGFISQYKWCKKNLNKDFFENKKKAGNTSLKPVFIVGMPRSGTTLLEQIIASHVSGYGAGELSMIKTIADDLGCAGNFDENLFQRINDLQGHDINSFAKKYLDRLERHSQTAKRIVDKMPQNQVFLWVISLLFPNAPIINCVRDPLDTCLSCFIIDFKDGHSYKESLFTVGVYYSIFSKFMDHWEKVISNPILTVQYEELTENPEAITREVIDHIGLDWDQNCLELRDRGHFSQTASNLQIRKGIYKTSIKRWQKYEKHLDPLKEGLAKGEKMVQDLDFSGSDII